MGWAERDRTGIATLLAGAGLMVGLAACAIPIGGGSPGGGSGGGADGGADVTKDLPKLTVPTGYDASKGWWVANGWASTAASTYPVAIASKAKAVGHLEQTGKDAYALKVRDAATGEVRFTGKPFSPGERVQWEAPDSDDSPEPEHSGVTVVRTGGKELFAVWMHARVPAKDLTKPHDQVFVAAYPADASGDAVAPARSGNVDLEKKSDVVLAQPTGPGLLVRWRDPDLVRRADRAATYDVTTGQGETGEPYEIAGLTSAGTLSAAEPFEPGPFAVADKWKYYAGPTPDGEKPTPDGANPVGAVGDYAASTWKEPFTTGDTQLWLLQDTGTGKIVSSVECTAASAGEFGNDQLGLALSRGPHQSPNGRYVVTGHAAFDTTTKKGWCFAGDDSTRGAALAGVGDSGTAWGYAESSDESADEAAPQPVQILLGGEAKVQSPDAESPITEGAGVGVFRVESATSPGFAVYPRKP